MVTMKLAPIYMRPSSARTLDRDFYRRPATDCVTDFIGKVLVRRTSAGRIAGVIGDIESHPAFTDDVHHGNTRTPRTAVLWEAGGVAYVYLIYGRWHQFAAVVNRVDVPDAVFIRGVVPVEGVEIMSAQWDKPRPVSQLTNTRASSASPSRSLRICTAPT